MKVNINNKSFHIDDKLAELYLKYVGKLDDNSICFLFLTEGIDPNKCKEEELPSILEKIIKNELLIREQLSKPKMIQEAIDFANSNNFNC